MFFVALAVAALLLLVDLIGMLSFAITGRPSFAWRISQENVFGPLFMADTVLLRKKPAPEKTEGGWREWLFLLVCDVVCDIAMPLIAVSGCKLTDNKQLLALTAWGVFRVVVSTLYQLLQLLGLCGTKDSSNDKGVEKHKRSAQKDIEGKATGRKPPAGGRTGVAPA